MKTVDFSEPIGACDLENNDMEGSGSATIK